MSGGKWGNPKMQNEPTVSESDLSGVVSSELHYGELKWQRLIA